MSYNDGLSLCEKIGAYGKIGTIGYNEEMG